MLRKCGLAGVFLLALSVAAQQQMPPPRDTQPPVQTPRTFPEDQDPGARPVPPDMPPDAQAAPPRELTNSEVQNQVQSKLGSEPLLRNNRLSVEVTDSEVVVSGTADNAEEHDLALQIAESYAGVRQVVDKVVIASKT